MQAHFALQVPAEPPGSGAAIARAWRHGRAALLELNLMLDALRDAGADPNMRSDVKLMAVDLAWTVGKIGAARGEELRPRRRNDE